MKLCWDRIDGFYLTKSGNLRNGKSKIYLYLNECKTCGEEFLGQRKDSKFCSLSCSSSGENNGMYGKGYLQQGALGPMYGKHHSEEIKEKIRKANLGSNNHFFGKRHSLKTKLKLGGRRSEERRKNISTELKVSKKIAKLI